MNALGIQWHLSLCLELVCLRAPCELRSFSSFQPHSDGPHRVPGLGWSQSAHVQLSVGLPGNPARRQVLGPANSSCLRILELWLLFPQLSGATRV